MEYCPHCMRPASGAVCASCGGQMNWTAPLGQLPLGTLLRGSENHTYQIGAARGQGGFGITYAAMDLSNGERVAVKEYFPTRCAQRNQLQQVMPMTGQDDNYRGGLKSFLEEAMMLSAVGALPSVVTVKDYFEANGTAYLVMEFVDGVPLHQVVANKGRMQANELLPMLPELLNDFAILHKAGVIHRDISPDNLILMPSGKLKILDFGSARSVQDGKSMTVLLKEGFSPVEQYMSRGQGAWTDVYALAATIYYCLTGTLPPPSVGRLEQDTLQRPNALGAGLTAEQEEAILCGLIVQPKSRPSNMEIFRDRLFPAGCAAAESPVHTNVKNAGGKWKDIGDKVKSAIPTKKETDPGTGSSFRTEDLHTEQPAKPAEESVEEPASAVTEEKPCSPPPTKKTKLGKKTIAAIAVALLAVAFGVFYASTHGTTDEGFRYKLSGGQATITGYSGDRDVVILPETIKDAPVKWIGEDAFAGHSEIESLFVQSDVVPMDSFDGCDGITLVSFTDDALVESWMDELAEMWRLRSVFFDSESMFRERADEIKAECAKGVAVCYRGQDTGFGRITGVNVSGGIAYAFTDTENAVVLELPEGADVRLLPATIGTRQVILPDGRLAGRNAYYGENADGYVYLVDEDNACVTITGYKGKEDVVVMDDYIDGYPVTMIGKNAFAGNSAITTAGFPTELKEIMDGAFKNCANLKMLAVFDNVSLAPGAFAGCSKLRCAMVPDGVSVDTGALPQNFKVYDYGMETGAGKLTFPYVADDGTIYGLTENDRLAVLDIAGGAVIAETVMDYPVTWVHKDAVSGVSSNAQITVPDNVLVAPEICNAVQWNVEDCNSAAWSWIWSNRISAGVNAKLGNTTMLMDGNLRRAMQIRARELSESDSHTRPDGSGWSTVMSECNVDWDFGYVEKRTLKGKHNRLSDELINELVEAYSVPEAEHNNKYYERVGISAYYNSATDTTHVICCAVIR